jgi:hypothetical protein
VIGDLQSVRPSIVWSRPQRSKYVGVVRLFPMFSKMSLGVEAMCWVGASNDPPTTRLVQHAPLQALGFDRSFLSFHQLERTMERDLQSISKLAIGTGISALQLVIFDRDFG